MSRCFKGLYRSEIALLGIAALLYSSFLVYLTVYLRFDMLRSDVLSYWGESLKWKTPFSAWWVPGYPLLIAAVRGITNNMVPPIGIMAGISAVAYLVAVSAVYRLAIHNRFRYPLFLGLVFALFPFVGLTYSVYPVADITAIALLLLAVSSLEKRQWVRFVVFSGACMIVQKVMWFFVPPLMLVAFVKHRESRVLVPYAFIPLVLWIGFGAVYHRDLAWFVRWSYENLFVSKSSLPVFDGLITPLLSGSAAKIAKGILVVLVMALTLVFAHYGFRRRQWAAMCISLSLFAMIVFVNSYEIWAVVRYSRLLVIPLSFVDTRFVDSQSRIRVRLAAGLILAVFLISNLAYGFYHARLYFVSRGGG
jgi:hypothetical protein